MIVTVLLWIVFFIADDKARKRIDGGGNTAVVVDLLTLTGTFLAVFTLLGVGFFKCFIGTPCGRTPRKYC